VAPFANTLATADLTGADLVRLLEQQWEAANCAAKPNSNAASAPVGTGSANGCGRMLQPSSNFSYSWNAAQPAGAPDGTGARVVASSLKIGGTAVVATQVYRVTFNSFQAPGGGDNFTVITNKGKNITNSGVIDIDAFVAYMKAHPNLAPPTPRVTRVN
jgi:5'-nucleotidase